MIISFNWLKDFVDIPPDLDPRELATRITLTTAEVDGIEHVEPNFTGLIAARVKAVRDHADGDKLKTVLVEGGGDYTSLTTAPDIRAGDLVLYAPPGALIAGHTIGTTDAAGRPSEGMIVAGQSIGLMQVGANAMFLPPDFEPGRPIADAPSSPGGAGASSSQHKIKPPAGSAGHMEERPPAGSRCHKRRAGAPGPPNPFDDWLIEIDNKSITHRPDCWGHYGIAREVAAILGVPLKPYDVTDPSDLKRPDLPEIPIEIDDAAQCPRYTGLVMKGLTPQPAPLWMQVRLALCGMRPIDLLVDLTNYIMLELGQPMHAFDGAVLPNIQVATATPGERFTTLDGAARTMPPGTLMIQCNRTSVAIAGIMGGAETEVCDKTDTVLLESANFDAATIRRAATAMGHRTEASTRFEKSLDPAHTVLGIARFHKLAGRALPGLRLASKLSDCYPAPTPTRPIELDCDFTGRFIGRPVTSKEAAGILEALEFRCEPLDGDRLRVTPPTFRATKDIEIEVDLIEEIARFIGYNNIEPVLPNVTARFFDRSPDLLIEERTLRHLCTGDAFAEVHTYVWYDDEWLARLGFDPGACLALANPIAENCSKFRKTLMPGLIAVAERNRHNFNQFQLVEIGTVFEPGHAEVETSRRRHLGLVLAQAGKRADAAVWDRLRVALDGWARQVLESRLAYQETAVRHLWEDPDRTCEIVLAGRSAGRTTLLPLACKQRIDERLKAWSIALAELNLAALADLIGHHEKLPAVPRHPQVRLDFSVLTDAAVRYAAMERQLAGFKHPLLKRLSFVGAYQGGSIPAGKRSLTFRTEIGLDERTLGDDDIQAFQTTFRAFLASAGVELRG